MRLIDADALGREVFFHTYSVPILETENKALSEVLHMIHNAPTVEVGYLTNCANCERVAKIRAKRPHGKWLDVNEDWFDYKCSICGLKSRWHWNYCPECGAKMDGGEEE